MKTYFRLFISLLFIVNSFNLSYSQGKDDKVVLCVNYDSLSGFINRGVAASIYKTAFIEDYSLVEKSLATVYPKTNNGYLVEIQILSLEKGENYDKYEKNSVLGFFVAGCKAFGTKYTKFNNTSCRFYADNTEDAVDAVKNGITFIIDNKYSLQGTLTDAFKQVCDSERPQNIPVKKPAVYLYPTETMNVSVKVKVNGKLTYTDPDYNEGWNVNAATNGIINNKYDYLFYEADLKKIELPNEGWVVEFTNLKMWFDEYLPKLGLNKKEKEQFEEYWIAKLKKANYYDIRILDNKFLSENMELLINPKPETLLRLNFYFKPLNSKIELNAPEIKEFTRKGFTVIEWGGIDGSEVMMSPDKSEFRKERSTVMKCGEDIILSYVL